MSQFTPGVKFGPMQESLVSRKAKVSPTASPEPYSLAEPPVLSSSPWPHSCRKTAAISPVFEQKSPLYVPERKKLSVLPSQ